MPARKNYLPLMILPLTIIAGVLFYYFKLQTGQKTALSETVQSRGESKSVLDQTLNKFKLKGFDPAGEANWELEGENAQIDPGQSVILDENVTLKLRDNTIIRTDHVNWSQGGGVLRTESVVTVDHENAKVRGRGAYGRPNEGYIQLNRDIEMTINYTTNLVCQGPLKIFYNLNKMEFYRKVKVTDTRGTLSASRMDVMFDPETKKIKEIIAMGTVIIKRGEDTTRSNRAIYSVETGSIRLEGNPEVTLKKGSGGILDGALRNQRVEKIL